VNPSTADLYLAYRQAKIALYYERRGVGLLDLAKYEEELPQNLTHLQRHLEEHSNWFDDIEPGEVWIVPKRLHPSSANNDPVIRIGRTPSDVVSRRLDVQVRLGPSPEFAILEVLYLWRFGHILDSLLSDDSLGYRLDLRNGRLQRHRRWLFEYWPREYQRFRTEPLDAAKASLEDGTDSVCIVSADLASFYDTIDPSFLVTDDFVTSLEAVADDQGVEFDPIEYRAATGSLLGAYQRFRDEASARTSLSIDTGVPIGALTSRVVANVALTTLDEHIASVNGVVCYRRYVDDMVVVSQSSSGTTFDDVLQRFFPLTSPDNDTVRLSVGELDRTGSAFQLQKRKVRVHNLTGVPGQDFVDAVKTDFDRVVSARRAFLDTPTLLEDGVSHLIRVSQSEGSPLRVLRNADRSRLERFSLSTSLHTLERVSSMVDSEDALRVVRGTLKKIGRVMNEDENWVENLDVGLRILKLAISTSDWKSCAELNDRIEEIWGTIDALQESEVALYYCGRQIDPSASRSWVWLRNYLHHRRLEAVCSALPIDIQRDQLREWLPHGLRVETRILGAVALRNRAQDLSAADLRARDREDDQAVELPSSDAMAPLSEVLAEDDELSDRLESIGNFVEICRELRDPPWLMAPARLFLTTRPPSYFDIARRMLYRTESQGFSSRVFEELLTVVNAVRGTDYQDPIGRVVDKRTVAIPTLASMWSLKAESGASNPRIILGNLVNKNEWWERSATVVPGSPFGNPYLGFDRLLGLDRVISRADRVTASNRQATLLVLPELSLPRQWFRTVARHVVRSGGYGLVVGLEYLHQPARRYVRNQAFAVLPAPFSAVATWPWTKRVPARVEKEGLSTLPTPIEFPPNRSARPPRTTVESPLGTFSVLICSELIESRRVADLLGRVELVLCPAWNTDTSSYDHLIQSVGFQLHAIIAIANDGHYSDCRAWAPLGVRWQRNLCRLIERDVNDIVHVEMPIKSLRAFRSNPVNQVCDKCGKSHSKWRPLPPEWP
jgi:hypothetical protein